MTQASVNTPINKRPLNILSLVCSFHFPTVEFRKRRTFACLRTTLFARVKLSNLHHHVMIMLHSPMMLSVLLFCAVQLFTHFVIVSSDQGMLNTWLRFTQQRIMFPFVISRGRYSIVSKAFLKTFDFVDTLMAKINKDIIHRYRTNTITFHFDRVSEVYFN